MEEGNLDPRPPDNPPTSMTSFTGIDAQFDGHCRGCNLGIHRGQLITRMSDGSYRHDDCADADASDRD